MNACPKCGLITGVHSSTLPGCMCLLTPQRKEWVRLTDDDKDEIRELAYYEFDDISKAIEAKLKEKNA